MVAAETELLRYLSSFWWCFVRISGLFIAAPLFGANVTAFLRVTLAFMVAAAIWPILPAVDYLEPFSATGMLLTARELLIGIAMGVTFRVIFAALELAGQLVAMQMGLGFAMAVDPNGGPPVPLISYLYNVLGILIFLAINGHGLLIALLIESFRRYPVALVPLVTNDAMTLTLFGSQMFIVGVSMALPAVIALLALNLAFGVITRAAPQFNLFVVGFPMSLLLGFWVVLVSLPSLLTPFSNLFRLTVDLARSMWGS